MEIVSVKRCCDCGLEKPLDDFGRHSRAKDGKYSVCRMCRALYYKARKSGRRRREVARAVEPIEAIRRCFEPKVDKRGADECWRWKGYINTAGYGAFHLPMTHFKKGAFMTAHRVAYWLHYGEPIPSDLFGCHSCDHRWCVNPRHIWPGTQKENMQDAVAKGRLPRGKDHYMQLHPELIVRGEKHAGSKLKKEQVREIRRLREEGRMSQAKVANLFGVCPKTVKLIVERKAWGHID